MGSIFNELIRVVLIAIIVALFALNFKSIKSEYAILITISASIVFLFLGIEKMGYIIKYIKQITGFIDADSEYIQIILKIVGISYISDFAKDICVDCGFGTIGNQVQIFLKLTTLVISLPVLLQIVKYISALLVGGNI